MSFEFSHNSKEQPLFSFTVAHCSPKLFFLPPPYMVKMHPSLFPCLPAKNETTKKTKQNRQILPRWLAAMIDLNGIIDLLYSLTTLGISRPDGSFFLLTDLRNPLLGEKRTNSQLISDKPMEFCVACALMFTLAVKQRFTGLRMYLSF